MIVEDVGVGLSSPAVSLGCMPLSPGELSSVATQYALTLGAHP